MYKTLIANYIKKMTLEDVEHYVNQNYPDVTDAEIQVIYKYLKNRWVEIYDEDKQVLEDLKKEVSAETYDKITKLLATAVNFKNREFF